MKTSRRFLPMTAVIVLLLLLFGTLLVRGYWNESIAVHIKAQDIEPSTLIIGTHLIHLSALNDPLYEIAQTSAEESSQIDVFYKSELADGAWFNITAATTLEDITTGGMPVEDEVIEALFLTHHTRSDKVTYDLRTNEPVNIFDIRDPYALESLDEVAPLKMQYDFIRESQGDNDVTARIDLIWETPIAPNSGPGTEKLTEYDKALADLKVYQDVLAANNGGSREMEAVTGVMDAVDASRRYEVFLIAEQVLSTYLDELAAKPPPPEELPAEEPATDAISGVPSVGRMGLVGISAAVGDSEPPPAEGGDAEGGDAEGAEDAAPPPPAVPPDPELLSAVAESLGNVQNALITYGGKMLDEGTTVISAARFGFSNDLITHAGAADHAACDVDVGNLIYLENILNDIFSNRERELALLDGTLLPQATSKYTAALWQGESAAYRAAVAKQSAQALLNGIARENAGDVNSKRNELEFFIESKCRRMETQAAMDYIDQLLALATEGFAAGVPNDAFAQGAKDSADAHITFLTDKRRSLELALGGNAMDKLAAEKEDLQNKRLAALDDNDLAGAKALEGEIADKESQLRGMEKETAAQLSQLGQEIGALTKELEDATNSGDTVRASALDSQLSQAKANRDSMEKSLSDGSLGAMVSQLKQAGLDNIKSGPDEQLSGAVEGLGGLLGADPTLVLPALQELHDALAVQQAMGGGIGTGGTGTDGIGAGGTGGEGANAATAAMATIEQAILDNPDAYGAAMRQQHSAEDLQALFTDYLADNDLGSYGDLSLLVALQLYYDETSSSAALGLIASTTRRIRNLGSPLVYERINDGTGEYLTLSAIQAITGRRYLWDQNRSMGILAQGADYYGFTLYSSRVVMDREGDKTEVMPRAAKYLAGLHIPEEYAQTSFGVSCVYLADTTLGCICNDAVMAHAENVLALFLS